MINVPISYDLLKKLLVISRKENTTVEKLVNEALNKYTGIKKAAKG